MQVIYDENNQNVPVKAWVEDVESIRDNGLWQAINASNLPFVYKHVALMPDCHKGYGVPIGSVLALKDYIIPNAVGVDVGCGMRFVESDIDTDRLINEMTDSGELGKEICGSIRRKIPIGFNKHKYRQNLNRFRDDYNELIEQSGYYRTGLGKEYQDSFFSLGTLGGGNHFIELQRCVDTGKMCVMIHSGSRHFGHTIATHFNDVAEELNEKWCSESVDGLAFFPYRSEVGQQYEAWMKLALRFAKHNRRMMMNTVKQVFYNTIGSVDFTDDIDVHHNYVDMENHFGENVLVHRKGAIRVRERDAGIIPGAMASKSYIVEGIGNEESFHSASHGAGRSMSRNQAKRDFTTQDMVEDLNDRGVILSTPNISECLDEYRKAYKNVEDVIEQQKDLIEVKKTMETVCVIKS